MITLGFALVVLGAAIVRLGLSGHQRRRAAREQEHQLTMEMAGHIRSILHNSQQSAKKIRGNDTRVV